MAMEIHVLSDQRLTSITEWQRVIDAEAFPLRLSPDVQLDTVSGFLPAQLDGKNTGFECYHDNADALINGDSEINFGRRWKFALGFRFVGDFTELRAAWMAATAYARATAGVVYDPQEGRLYSAPEALQAVRQIERDWPAFESAVQAVTRKFAEKS